MTEAKYSYVSANLINTTTHSTFAPPFDTKTFGFIKLAFTGVESTELPLLTTPDSIRGLEVIDPVKAINNYNFGGLANYTVALSHLYHDVDVSYLAPNVKGVNLIIGALPFTLNPYPEVVNGIPIVQTGGNGNSVGKVVLEFETTANSVKLLDTKYELIPINDSVSEDPTIKALLEPYNTQLKAKMDEVIGETLVDLERGITGKPNLGDFLADWMRNVAGTDIAILNGGIMRAPILKGPITVGTVYTVLPFDNLLVKLEITGKQVVEALETGWSPQISGIRIKINLKNPPGSRVVEVLVGGQPIDLNKVYTVVVSSFQATGGDAYTVFKQAISSKWVTGRWMRDDLVDYIKANPKVNVIPDGRITYVDP
jgi:2',3'-cyclic-nucleotide 2'-phosphodiesterase (5'-nucleotidase family)